jgi:hypothetical protein
MVIASDESFILHGMTAGHVVPNEEHKEGSDSLNDEDNVGREDGEDVPEDDDCFGLDIAPESEHCIALIPLSEETSGQ